MLAKAKNRPERRKTLAMITAMLLSGSPSLAQAQDTDSLVASGLGYTPQQQEVLYDLFDVKEASHCTGKTAPMRRGVGLINSRTQWKVV